MISHDPTLELYTCIVINDALEKHSNVSNDPHVHALWNVVV